MWVCSPISKRACKPMDVICVGVRAKRPDVCQAQVKNVPAVSSNSKGEVHKKSIAAVRAAVAACAVMYCLVTYRIGCPGCHHRLFITTCLLTPQKVLTATVTSAGEAGGACLLVNPTGVGPTAGPLERPWNVSTPLRPVFCVSVLTTSRSCESFTTVNGQRVAPEMECRVQGTVFHQRCMQQTHPGIATAVACPGSERVNDE